MILTFPAYCSLTKQDIEEIRKIVKEEIQHVDKRIDGLDKRIDDLDNKMSQRIDDMNTGLNARIDSLQNLLYVILAGIFGLVGFVLWDRRSALAPAVRKAKELEEREEKLERVIREFSLKEPRLAEVVRAVGL
ncbi:MAG: hypothetical protein AB1397_06860, partial [bacterium]